MHCLVFMAESFLLGTYTFSSCPGDQAGSVGRSAHVRQGAVNPVFDLWPLKGF